MKSYRRSRHVSFFTKSEDVFLYHDLVGDILRMDARLLAFLDYFAEPRTEGEARRHWKNDFLKDDLDAFFEILPEHLALVAPETDEEKSLDDWHPVRGPWILFCEGL